MYCQAYDQVILPHLAWAQGLVQVPEALRLSHSVCTSLQPCELVLDSLGSEHEYRGISSQILLALQLGSFR